VAKATISVVAPTSGGTVLTVSQNGVEIIPGSVLMDDTDFGGGDVVARVLASAPDGTEAGLVVREAQAGAAGTGISPPTGGSGLLGWLSGIYNLLLSGLSIGIGGSDYKVVAPQVSTHTQVKATGGILNAVLVTSPVEGSPPIYLTDGIDGPVIEIVPAGAALGYRRTCDAKAYTSIYVTGDPNAPGLTVFYT